MQEQNGTKTPDKYPEKIICNQAFTLIKFEFGNLNI